MYIDNVCLFVINLCLYGHLIFFKKQLSSWISDSEQFCKYSNYTACIFQNQKRYMINIFTATHSLCHTWKSVHEYHLFGIQTFICQWQQDTTLQITILTCKSTCRLEDYKPLWPLAHNYWSYTLTIQVLGMILITYILKFIHYAVYKGKVIPLQAWCGPEGGKRYSSTLPWPRH